MDQFKYIRSLLATLDSQEGDARKAASDELDLMIYPRNLPSDGRCIGPVWDEACRLMEEHYSRLRETGLLVPFVEAISAGGENARAHSAVALGAAKEKRAIPLLVRALRDKSPKVRAAAARAMSFVSDPSAIDALAESLKDADADVRADAAFSLSLIGDRRAVAALLGLLASKAERDRAAALFALGGILDAATLPIIRSHLRDKSKRVRKFAKYALSGFDTRRREGARREAKDKG